MTTRVLARIAPEATDMIRADHARVLTTFHRYKSELSAAAKRSLVATICLALEVHAQIEEEIFYPAMASVDNALVGRFIPEHDRMRSLIGEEPRFSVDYIEVVNASDLTTPNRLVGAVRLLAAARLGKARLIDNVEADACEADQ